MLEIDLETSTRQEIDAVLDNIEQLPRALAAFVVGRGLRAAANVVRDRARQLVPVLSGALQKSIRARSSSTYIQTSSGRKRVPGTGAVVNAGGRGAAHAMLVEYGTVHSQPHPYLAPAVMGTLAQQSQAGARAARVAYNRLAAQLSAGPDGATKRIRRLAAL